MIMEPDLSFPSHCSKKKEPDKIISEASILLSQNHRISFACFWLQGASSGGYCLHKSTGHKTCFMSGSLETTRKFWKAEVSTYELDYKSLPSLSKTQKSCSILQSNFCL